MFQSSFKNEDKFSFDEKRARKTRSDIFQDGVNQKKAEMKTKM